MYCRIWNLRSINDFVLGVDRPETTASQNAHVCVLRFSNFSTSLMHRLPWLCQSDCEMLICYHITVNFDTHQGNA